MRRTLAWLTVAGLLLGSSQAFAQAAPITRFARFVGNVNFVATGGSLRTQPNTGNPCLVGATNTAAVVGIPAGSTILAAYLYWGGSGGTVDANVTLNGNAIAASRTFTTTFVNGGTNFPYFGGFANVTALVAGNGNFTFGGLTVTTGAPHCGSSAVVSGWGLVVIYQRAAENLRAINVFDGLQFFRGSSLTLTPDGFRIPTAPIDGRLTIISWEGDPQNSTALNGFSEQMTFNGNALDDGINVAGSDPLLQPYDGTVNSIGVATSYGVDVDTFTVNPFLSPGQTSATTVYSAGGDLVLLTAQVVSVTSDRVVDLNITKTHTGNFTVGSNGTYTLRVSNAAGVALDPEVNTVTITDTLPAGLTYVSGVGAGWSCGAVGQTVTCTHPPGLPPGSSFPDLTLTVAVGPTAAPAVTNSATVSSASYDLNAANNTVNDPTTVIPIYPTLVVSKSSQAFSDPINNTTNPKRIPGGVTQYSITVTNQGPGWVDASTLVITDPVPANSDLYVSTASGNPIVFIDGTPASGLAFNYAANVSYSNQPGGGAPYNYTPVPDASGFDPNVTGFRIAPTGMMNPATVAGNPSFIVRFRVRVR
ncbi:MAG TPA: hypothetical protein VLB75_02625 [Steroidobacteraceae bacterium]|nr:hypothetical protein [Steroidobacteraceae bacterium]